MSTENETFKLIMEYSDTPEAQSLIEKIEKSSDGYVPGHVFAALIHVLITEHITMNLEDDRSICEACANGSLTELFQTIREIHRGVLEDIPKHSH